MRELHLAYAGQCLCDALHEASCTDLLFHIRQWQHRPTDALGQNQDLFKIQGFLTYIHMGGYGHNGMTHSGFLCLYRNLLCFFKCFMQVSLISVSLIPLSFETRLYHRLFWNL